MTVLKSRQEISLSRLLARCQEIANTSDPTASWRLPTFLTTCEKMLSSLPVPPSPLAPSEDNIQEYTNKITFLKRLLPPPEESEVLGEGPPTEPPQALQPLPQGPSATLDTVSKQILQKVSQRQNLSARDQLFGTQSSGGGSGELGGQSLDAMLARHKAEQERVAGEMLELTRNLKEQSAAAGSIVRGDTDRLQQAADLAEHNLQKLQVETSRVHELSGRGNCRCWIWLMMGLVIMVFVGMVLLMRLFRKRVPLEAPVKSEL